MSSEDAYKQWLNENFSELIDSLQLEDHRKNILKKRWLDQVIWIEGKSAQARTRYYTLRLSAIIGGLIVPALIGLNFEGTVSDVFRWIVFAVSLIVAISSAVEEFFQYGERWRHYRKSVEMLKSEGWQFFQLCGAYSRRKTHADAYEKFAGRVEEILQTDVQQYIAEVVKEQTEQNEGES